MFEFIQRGGSWIGGLLVAVAVISSTVVTAFPDAGGLINFFSFVADYHIQFIIAGFTIIVLSSWIRHKWLLYIAAAAIFIVTILQWTGIVGG